MISNVRRNHTDGILNVASWRLFYRVRLIKSFDWKIPNTKFKIKNIDPDTTDIGPTWQQLLKGKPWGVLCVGAVFITAWPLLRGKQNISIILFPIRCFKCRLLLLLLCVCVCVYVCVCVCVCVCVLRACVRVQIVLN